MRETATLYSAKPSLSGLTHILKGFAGKFTFSINMPIIMKPTSKGVNRRVGPLRVLLPLVVGRM